MCVWRFISALTSDAMKMTVHFSGSNRWNEPLEWRLKRSKNYLTFFCLKIMKSHVHFSGWNRWSALFCLKKKKNVDRHFRFSGQANNRWNGCPFQRFVPNRWSASVHFTPFFVVETQEGDKMCTCEVAQLGARVRVRVRDTQKYQISRKGFRVF